MLLVSFAAACYGLEAKYNNNALLKNTGKASGPLSSHFSSKCNR